MLDALTQRLSSVVKTLRGHARLTEENIQEALREVRLALLDADAGVPVVKDFIARVKEKALGQEVATRGITVNCVAPGFIESPMTDSLTEAQKAQILGTIPTARLGTGTEVAAACVYLASDEAAYVTGQTLHVNGGMAMI